MKTGLLLIPVMLAAGAAAFAEKPQEGRDGPISLKEAEAKAEERFAAIDADGDGGLTAAELFAAEHHADRVARMQERKFARLDRDSDGVISAEEFARRIERLAKLDSNDDGEVSREELRAGKRHKRSRWHHDG